MLLNRSCDRVIYRAALVASIFAVGACGGGASSGDSSGIAIDKRATATAITTASQTHPATTPDQTQSDLINGISPTTREANYGKPQEAQAIAAMAKRLAVVFEGRYAKQPELLPGAAAAATPTANAKASATSLAKVGTKAAAATLAPQAVYRFFNTLTGVHFFTASTEERDWVVANLPWFHLEGAAFFALPGSAEGLTPVYRFYNKVSATHFYTVSAAERDEVVAKLADIFTFEGVSWYASAQANVGWSPIYRFFNTQTGTHFYTASASERDSIRNTLPNFAYEGVAYQVRSTATPFVPVANPSSCSAFAAPVLAAGLPANYSASLVGPAASTASFLNNAGDVAYRTYNSALGRTVVMFRSSAGGLTQSLYPAITDPSQAIDPPVYELVSLNDAGELLVYPSLSMGYGMSQTLPLDSFAPDALILSGGSSVAVPGLKIPRNANHRAGRFSFMEAMSPSPYPGRYWAWTSAVSYLDGSVKGQTSNSLFLANAPVAVNHCGYGIDMSGRTESGIVWQIGDAEVDRWSFQFAYGADDSLRPTMINNRRAMVGYSEGYPVADKLIGFMKWTANQDLAFNNYVPLDINEKLVAVGHSVVPPVGPVMPPAVFTQVDGYFMTSDGQTTPLKNRVPSLNQAGTHILPLKINDNLQILANVELACNAATNLNALSEACGTKYAYLLTPQ